MNVCALGLQRSVLFSPNDADVSLGRVLDMDSSVLMGSS